VEPRDLFHESVDAVGPVKEAVLGVNVEMNEFRAWHAVLEGEMRGVFYRVVRCRSTVIGCRCRFAAGRYERAPFVFSYALAAISAKAGIQGLRSCS
jgi:hypothetical protein